MKRTNISKVVAIVVFTLVGFLSFVNAAVKGCPPIKILKPRPTESSLKQILTRHLQWIKDYNLEDRRNWSGRTAKELRRILSDQRRANLSNTNLQGVVLSNAILIGAKLDEVNLRHSNLEGADLSFASLRCADLSHSNLKGAVLFDATLERIDLTNSILCGSDMINASIVRAVLDDSNLDSANVRGVNGLEGSQCR
ncbi:MAG: pentapeptide repeat-containing protein [bacterium]|nr:pentapeptide repeat-containing protein [bacterium]